ncbi:MAG: response regulator [Actinomycetota bacterium]
MTKPRIRLLVADAQPLVGQSIGGALAQSFELEMLEQLPETGLDAVEAVLKHRPDVTLLDYWMPDMEGPAAVRLIRAKAPAAKVVILSWFHSPLEVQRAFDAGARAFVSKGVGVDELADTITQITGDAAGIVSGQPREVADWVKQRADPDKETWDRLKDLSRRQIEIINLISLDLAPKEIGEGLLISPETVKVHVRNILAKTGARSQREIVALARSAGLIRN